jgi:hypothetical protein
MKEGQPNHFHVDQRTHTINPTFDEVRQANLDKLYRRLHAPSETLDEGDFQPDEAKQLKERGAIFPLEVRGAPEKKLVKAVQERVIFQQ